MKKSISILAALAVLLLVVYAGLGFWLRPQVEQMVRQKVERLPALLSMPGQVEFDKVSLKEVEYAPLSRKLILRGFTLQGQMTEPSGNLVYTLDEMVYRLPLGLLPLFTPWKDSFLSGEGHVLLADLITANGWGCRVENPAFTLQSVVQRQSIEGLSAKKSLLRDALSGTPLADQTRLLYDVRVGLIRSENSRYTMTAKGQKPQDSLIKNVYLRHWNGAALAQLSMEGMDVQGKDFSLRLAGLSLKEITLPEAPLLRRLLEMSKEAAPDSAALEALMTDMLSKGAPLVKECLLTDVDFKKNDAAFTLKKMQFSWPSNQPGQYETLFTDLTLPSALLEPSLGLKLRNLPVLLINAEIKSQTQADKTRQDSGFVHAAGLGRLNHSMNVSEGAGPGAEGLAILFSQTFKDLKLAFTDEGLSAQVAANVAPQASDTKMLVRSALAGLLQGTPENQALALAVENFVARPGQITLESRPGLSFQLMKALGFFMSNNPAALLSVTSTPGPQSLEEQLNKLGATR